MKMYEATSSHQNKKSTIKRAILKRIIALLVIVLIIAYGYLLKLVTHEFDDVGFIGDEPITIALITDLHACYYGDNQAWLIDALTQKQPDVILLGGDIYDDKNAV